MKHTFEYMLLRNKRDQMEKQHSLLTLSFKVSVKNLYEREIVAVVDLLKSNHRRINRLTVEVPCGALPKNKKRLRNGKYKS